LVTGSARNWTVQAAIVEEPKYVEEKDRSSTRRLLMCDSDNHQGYIVDTSFSRRSVVLTMSAAVAAGSLPTAALAMGVVETDVIVPTPDGTADAALFHPAGSGSWPAVLMWPDILGLRPVFRDMGRRLAAEGYVVLVPNPFYRTKRAPIVTGPFDFNDPKQFQPLMALKATLTDAAVDRDAAAFITFLDKQKQTDRRKGAGVQGYCFAGPLAFHTAAVRSDRIRAVGSFHGGGLVTKDASSPHLLIPRTKASFVVAIAGNDDQKQPEAKDVLKAEFAKAKRPAVVEVYPADHGWCVPGGPTYDKAAAERAWAELLRLYRANLV
jgi:carboxymethylenebutenolidase